MNKEKFPSKAFPAFPEIELEVLFAGWENKEVKSSVMALIKRTQDPFESNILIDIQKVEPDYTLDKSKEELLNLLEGYEGLQIFSDNRHEINTREWQIIEFAYLNKQAGALAQLSAVTFIEHYQRRFMVSFTGTTTIKEENENVIYHEIQEILKTIKVENPKY